MKELRYVCAQPRTLYYAWQVEVMINNFLKHGIKGENIDILVGWNPNDGTMNQDAVRAWEKLIAKYSTVSFHVYRDTREYPIYYIPSIRPNLLKQYYQAHPELADTPVFYHDCDIVFTKTPDFSDLLTDDKWYVSNTNNYLNSAYVLSKGQDVYDKMCSIVGIDPEVPKQHNNDSGGAQYILKNINAKFWEKVQKDSEQLFHQITALNAKKKQANPEYHELQIWCADMWAVLWNGWMLGKDIKVTSTLDFSWATDPVDRWNQTTIYHNAGVTCGCGRQFYKGLYTTQLPYNIQESDFNQTVNNFNYVKEIIETASNSCLV